MRARKQHGVVKQAVVFNIFRFGRQRAGCHSRMLDAPLVSVFSFPISSISRALITSGKIPTAAADCIWCRLGRLPSCHLGRS